MKQISIVLAFMVAFMAKPDITRAQPPQSIAYQAVARNSSGNLIASQTVSLRFSIHNATASGVVVYSETQTATTNALGLFSAEVGQGSAVTGTFPAIAWGAGAKFLQVEMDAAGGTSYIDMGTTKLSSVPYALHAGNGVPAGNVLGQMLYWNGTAWISVAPGTNGQALTFCNGVPIWGECMSLPVLATSASLIRAHEATCGGNITDDGGAMVTERGVCYGTSSNPTTAGNHIMVGSGAGTFNSLLTGLSSGVTYHTRAYAVNNAGTAYGNDLTFTTQTPVLATLTTGAASDIARNSFTASGIITQDGFVPVTERGFCYSTSANPSISGPRITSGTGTGSFTKSIANLIAGTTYHVRAYAVNEAGTAYGNDVSFTTVAPVLPTVNTGYVSNLLSNACSIAGTVTDNGGSPVTMRGICYSTSPNPTIAGTYVSGGAGNGNFSANLSGLTPNTLYYERAFATNSVGTSYGTEFQFTTYYHHIGESFGGGIIYSLDGTTQHGLIVAPVTLGGINWQECLPPCTTATAVNAYSFTDGVANTNAMIAALSAFTNAGKSARAYRGGGFTDWYLPAINELEPMNGKETLLGITDYYYWSSTAASTSAGLAYIYNFYHNYSESVGKNTPYVVRPIRKF